jgi:dihydrofolate synthase/folylpolyglutamate synthase
MATLGNTKILCDTAHNKEGLSIVLRQKKETYEKLHIVLGVVNDKDEILPLFPKTPFTISASPTFLVA